MTAQDFSAKTGRGHDLPFGFDSAFLHKLERISFLYRRAAPGPFAGRHPSHQRGSSVEFADFRDYRPGDDFRRVDWNAYARLDKLFLRLYVAEQITCLTLYLDHSASMQFGGKAEAAGRLAAVLSFIALDKDDRVQVVGWSDRTERAGTGGVGRRAVPSVWREISQIMQSRKTSTDFRCISDEAAQHGQRGMAVLLTDFLSDSDWRSALRTLCARGGEVCAVQILAPEELDPQLRGDWALLDAETGAEVEVTVTPRLLRRYEEELVAHTEAVRAFCRGHGIAFLQLSAEQVMGDDLLRSLEAAGVLR